MGQAAEKFATVIGGIALFAGAIIFLVPAATALGALVGWIVGWFFGETIMHVLAQLGVRDIAMWQLGATLGFVGGFLRTKVTHGNEGGQ